MITLTYHKDLYGLRNVLFSCHAKLVIGIQHQHTEEVAAFPGSLQVREPNRLVHCNNVPKLEIKYHYIKILIQRNNNVVEKFMYICLHNQTRYSQVILYAIGKEINKVCIYKEDTLKSVTFGYSL